MGTSNEEKKSDSESPSTPISHVLTLKGVETNTYLEVEGGNYAKTPKEVFDNKIDSIVCLKNVNRELTTNVEEKIKYINALKQILLDNNIQFPSEDVFHMLSENNFKLETGNLVKVFENASVDEIRAVLDALAQLKRDLTITVTYRDLGLWTMLPVTKIPTVQTALRNMLCGPGKYLFYTYALYDIYLCLYMYCCHTFMPLIHIYR